MFSSQDLYRIAKQVIRSERAIQNRPGPGRRSPIISSVGFHARITGRAGDKYSWVRIDAEELEGTTEENYAKEVNGSEDVVTGDIVWLKPSRTGDEFHYQFIYVPGIKRATTTEVPGGGSATVTTTRGQTVTVHNVFSCPVPAGICHIAWVDEQWEYISADCEDCLEV